MPVARINAWTVHSGGDEGGRERHPRRKRPVGTAVLPTLFPKRRMNDTAPDSFPGIAHAQLPASFRPQAARLRLRRHRRALRRVSGSRRRAPRGGQRLSWATPGPTARRLRTESAPVPRRRPRMHRRPAGPGLSAQRHRLAPEPARIGDRRRTLRRRRLLRRRSAGLALRERPDPIAARRQPRSTRLRLRGRRPAPDLHRRPQRRPGGPTAVPPAPFSSLSGRRPAGAGRPARHPPALRLGPLPSFDATRSGAADPGKPRPGQRSAVPASSTGVGPVLSRRTTPGHRPRQPPARTLESGRRQPAQLRTGRTGPVPAGLP